MEFYCSAERRGLICENDLIDGALRHKLQKSFIHYRGEGRIEDLVFVWIVNVVEHTVKEVHESLVLCFEQQTAHCLTACKEQRYHKNKCHCQHCHIEKVLVIHLFAFAGCQDFIMHQRTPPQRFLRSLPGPS